MKVRLINYFPKQQIFDSRFLAVILNEHLTKALRLLKKGGPEENVNRYCPILIFLEEFKTDKYLANLSRTFFYLS